MGNMKKVMNGLRYFSLDQSGRPTDIAGLAKNSFLVTTFSPVKDPSLIIGRPVDRLMQDEHFCDREKKRESYLSTEEENRMETRSE